ncbi:hypothetical protein JOD67_006689 [Tenggerimyces flavus]|nr:hypothetical protein [Tenggerimyces flavus]
MSTAAVILYLATITANAVFAAADLVGGTVRARERLRQPDAQHALEVVLLHLGR